MAPALKSVGILSLLSMSAASPVNPNAGRPQAWSGTRTFSAARGYHTGLKKYDGYAVVDQQPDGQGDQNSQAGADSDSTSAASLSAVPVAIVLTDPDTLNAMNQGGGAVSSDILPE
jgi:hypothetical protein